MLQRQHAVREAGHELVRIADCASLHVVVKKFLGHAFAEVAAPSHQEDRPGRYGELLSLVVLGVNAELARGFARNER
jgi:hypothetical protein